MIPIILKTKSHALRAAHALQRNIAKWPESRSPGPSKAPSKARNEGVSQFDMLMEEIDRAWASRGVVERPLFQQDLPNSSQHVHMLFSALEFGQACDALGLRHLLPCVCLSSSN